MAVKALIIDPTTTRHSAIERLVDAGKEVNEFITVHNSQQALRLLQEDPVELIFFAWTTATRRDGLQLLRQLRKRENWGDIPFLACTDDQTMESVAALDGGASDCLCLQSADEENLARIRAGLRLRERSAAQRKKMQHLAHMAVTDMLTSLYNRAYFDATIELETARSRRTGYQVSLLLIDLDHFKRINDTYGHPIGDEVIRTVAALFQEASRKSDVVCRYGGEEFAILLPGATAADALQIAERLRRKIAAIAPSHLPISCSISVSIGISCSNGRDDVTSSRLIEEADIALYSCKQNGRNRSKIHGHGNITVTTPTPCVFPSLAIGRA